MKETIAMGNISSWQSVFFLTIFSRFLVKNPPVESFPVLKDVGLLYTLSQQNLHQVGAKTARTPDLVAVKLLSGMRRPRQAPSDGSSGRLELANAPNNPARWLRMRPTTRSFASFIPSPPSTSSTSSASVSGTGHLCNSYSFLPTLKYQWKRPPCDDTPLLALLRNTSFLSPKPSSSSSSPESSSITIPHSISFSPGKLSLSSSSPPRQTRKRRTRTHPQKGKKRLKSSAPRWTDYLSWLPKDDDDGPADSSSRKSEEKRHGEASKDVSDEGGGLRDTSHDCAIKEGVIPPPTSLSRIISRNPNLIPRRVPEPERPIGSLPVRWMIRNDGKGKIPYRRIEIEKEEGRTLSRVRGNDTDNIHGGPFFVDEETFKALEAEWDPKELEGIRTEEKEEWGIDEDIPNNFWLPVRGGVELDKDPENEGHDGLQSGNGEQTTITRNEKEIEDYRDRQKKNLNGIQALGIDYDVDGYDYVERFFDPARNISWSYKRANVLKTSVPPPPDILGPIDMSEEKDRRYFIEEKEPPRKKLDDDIFRQGTLADEMTKGMTHNPPGTEQWQFTSINPFGVLPEYQNFWLTKAVRDNDSRKIYYNSGTEDIGDIDYFVDRARSGELPQSCYTNDADCSILRKSVDSKDERDGFSKADNINGPASASESPSSTALPTTTSSAAPADPSEASSLTSPPPPSSSSASIPSSSISSEKPLSSSLVRSLPPMRYRQLGRSDLIVSEIGLGTMMLGHNWDERSDGESLPSSTPSCPQNGRATNYQFNDEKAFELLDFAFDVFGVNFFDTAEIYPLPASPESYGRAEQVLGKWLETKSKEERRRIVIATKVAGFSRQLDWLPEKRRQVVRKWRIGQQGRKVEPIKALVDRGSDILRSENDSVAGDIKAGSRNGDKSSENTQLPGEKHYSNHESYSSLSAQQIYDSVAASLVRLGVDHIDLLQLHWPDRYVPLNASGEFHDVLYHQTDRIRMERKRREEVEEENGVGKPGNDFNHDHFDVGVISADKNRHHDGATLRSDGSVAVSMTEQVLAVKKLIEDKKIRAWGLSNETPFGLMKFCELADSVGLEAPPASVQLQYNLLCRNNVEKGFVELARPRNLNVGLIAYGALAAGVLTGKYLEWLEYPTTGRLLLFPSYMKRFRGSLAAKAVSEYYELAMRSQQPNLTLTALRWVLSRPFINSTLIGATDLYQLRENLMCLNEVCGGLTDQMERQLNYLHYKWRDPLNIIQ